MVENKYSNGEPGFNPKFHSQFKGLRRQVTASQLLDAEIIKKELFDQLNQGTVTVQEVNKMDSVQKYLQGTNSIAGVLVQSSTEKMSIYQAMRKGILRPGTALVLLEAQAATGFLIDPVKNKKLSVEQAVAEGLVGTELKDKLLSAERAVTGYTDPYTKNTISLFQALKKDLIVKDHGIRLLEAQIATGGIIDPINSHRVPVEVAYKRGYFDKEMSQILSDPSDDTKGFFDPNTHENLTYLQLLERGVKDPETGLCLLSLVKKGGQYVYNDEQMQTALKSATTTKVAGKYKGQTVSIWELLYSEYISEEKRRELLQQYKSGSLTIQQFTETIITTVEQSIKTTTTRTTTKTETDSQFKGLRRQVTASQLLDAEIIKKELFDQLNQGTVTVQEVNKMDSVQKYLQGTNSIAGVLVQSSTEKMSIYQAMRKGILRPGTALVLLEAQAATGFLIDPVKNKKLSVEQAVAEGLVGTELKDKLLSAERAVTGYTDPYTKNTISLFQALKKDLIVKDHGIRLLEAQIATGGIIDPINSHRVPVEVAYKRGYFDKEMSQILSDPSDDTKGFFDPNTHENLTYLQLLERGVKDPETGLCLLSLVKKGGQYVYNDEQMQTALKSATTTKVAGKYKGQTVSIWELLYSEYISEEKRRELLQQYKSGSLTIQQFTETIITTVEQSIKTTTTRTTTKTETDSQFKGLRRQVTASQLLDAEIIKKELFDQLNQGTVTVQEVNKMDSVQKYLQGTNSIAGVLVQSSTEKMSIYQAMRKGILRPGTALVLLEAQAATGFLIDPVKNKKLSVEQAVAEGLVGTELKDKLLSAERAVTGYTDPYTKNTISLFQALKKDLIVKDHGIRLLEAQIATGGIIDPINSHRVPVEVAYKRGYFDKEMSQILSDPSDDTKGFFDPNTHENLTYLQLLERGVKDPETGLCLLSLVKKGGQYVYNDEQMQTALKSATTTKVAGKYKGQTVSIWELLYSEYISEEKRRELLQQYKSGSLTIQQFTETIITTVEQSIKTTTTRTTTKTETDSQFKGLRRQVTASQLLDAEIIKKELFDQLNQGTVTVQEVNKMDSVQKYLQGTNSIAGVLVQSSTEKMSIYQAMRKGILRPGTALVLLEAQAATGFLIDPVKNKKLSVEQAVAEGLVGTELKDKLLSAERAVTGYTDPYTKNTISLFQALKKDLIVKDHGIRLLEAQIATGGIIDPINSHRVPVEVAYKRGYFDKEMSQILSDPSDDTKGFFDPNTHENLTYLQLLERGVKDPETGLCLLSLVKKGGQYVYNDEQMQTALKSATTTKVAGKYKGQTVSIWELLYSEYISEEKRRELLQQYKSGSLTIQQFTETIITTVEQSIKTTTTRTTTKTETDSQFKGLRRQVTASQLLDAEIIKKELFDQLNQGTVTVQEVNKMDSVQKYLQGTNSIAGVLVQSSTEKMSIYQAMRKGILRPGTALVLLEAQAATGFLIDPVKNKKLSVEQAVAEGLVGTELKDKLLSAERAVTGYTDPYTKNTISLFQALKKDLIVKDHGIRLLEAQIATGGIIDPINSHRVPVEVAYKRGYFDKEMSQILSDPSDDTKGFFDPNTHENLTYLQLLERGVKDPETGLCLLSLVKKGGQYVYNDEQMQTALKSATTTKVAGKYKGQTVSIWELLYSEYISEEKRRELLQQYKSGSLTIQQFTETIITTVEQSIKTTTTRTTTKTETDSQFKGLRRQVTASQLLDAEIIKKELFDQLNQGTVTVQEVNKMDSVQKYLQGTNSIAGVLVQSSTEKMSIYQAMRKGILRPGTALVLLEAQAATGFLIDPVKNKKLSVEQAVAEGLVGTELKDKLLSAERAVTGYTDPYTKNTISLFQALKKDLIVKDHGIRLLEAQIATGGIIDPINSHRVPVEVAYKRGYFDKEMSQILSDPSDDTKGFFDPNTHENLTYLQLLERGVKDPETGLCLLSLVKKGGQYVYNDEQMQTALKSATTTKVAGKYKGQTVSIWELLYSEYISEEKRRELLQQYKSGSLTIQQFTETIITTVEQSIKTTTTRTTTKTETDSQFKGLRRQVTASQLLDAEIIKKELFDQLNQGTVTVQEVNKMDSVQKYLQGTNSIAGVLVQSSTEKMSIYQAMRKGILRPGTALVLLEAQAATGFLIDPVKNKKLSVEQAVAEGLVGTELKDKLLSAERAVTGYTDPYTKNTISLFQALKKDLIVKDHGIRLLEAQIATGGIIDPINSHRVPVEVAYKRGYFDKEMSQILSDPSDDTKGFFDPNTHENLTYLQLLERGVKDPETGLCLLSLVKKGGQYVYNDEQMQTALKSATTTKVAGKYKGQTVSIWELLYSEYISEEKRRELLQQYKSGSLTIQQFTETIITTVEQSIKTTTTRTTTKTETDSQFKGLRRQVTASQLLDAEIIKKELFDQLNQGTVTVQEVNKMDSVQKYLQGTNSIAGVLVQSSTEKMSIYQAMRKGILRPGTALVLLEAQAATGFLIDPVKNKKLSVEQAVAEGLVGTELKDKLLSAERAVTGYTDPYTKNTISLFQALKKDLIVKDHGIRLLEAQIATGGIIDPINSHRVPVEVAYKRGYFDKEMSQILSDPSDDTKGFFDPNTHENLTYLQLLERGVKDPETGLCLLSLVKKGGQYVYNDEQMQTALKSATTTKVAGKYKGQTVSIWELLYSEYISEEKRRELLQQYKSGSLTIQQFTETIITTVEQSIKTTTTTTTTKTETDSQFKGLRRQVTASQLLDAEIIKKELFDQLNQGTVTVQEVNKMDSVQKYLQGTNSIAGVLVQSSTEKMSIYQAMRKGILRPGTALVLLEAQAATGFLIDPVKNKKLSVEQAVAEGLVGTELKDKLLSAERAVTGYTDPYTKNTISLFQALKKDLIVKDHGIRLLEAQIATGGIIDPINSHRVPVEVAYKRGYFDKEMSQILSDPSDDTKGFFDPNTHENLTYLQLLERGVKDPETGLCLLTLKI
ncbi:UNVERIFIED_CONTAM: hypothetical protein FKN15_029878 [Acipenser sinensis]